jgi:hypothetical protein
MRRCASCLVTLLLALLACTDAGAQVVRGRVTDRVSGEPVVGASVVLFERDSTVRATARTDENGVFAMLPPPGRYKVQVAHRGFRTVSSKELRAAATDTLNFEIHLPPQPLGLSGLDVLARPRATPDPSGFYRRQQEETGIFLGPVEIAALRPTRIPDLLRGVPGFLFYPSAGGELLWVAGHGRGCTPTVYLDGGLARRGTSTNRGAPGYVEDAGLMLDELINPAQLAALEVYQDGTDSPVRFRPVGEIGGGDCAVIVLWTRAGLGGR